MYTIIKPQLEDFSSTTVSVIFRWFLALLIFVDVSRIGFEMLELPA